MSIVVVGSIAFDTVKTPFGLREMGLGGAANYFAMAAKFFSQVSMVGVVGEDFPKKHLEYLSKESIDVSNISMVPGYSFHWQGEYDFDFNNAKTLKTELNVFKNFRPQLLDKHRDIQTIFLANIDPKTQIHVLKQMKKLRISGLDTMNYWIKNERKSLLSAISMVDILFINEAEIRELSGEYSIIKAAKAVFRMGARMAVIKRGEYGSILCADNHISFVPAYPLEEVFDPTGAGDSFAGGFLGYLSKIPKVDFPALKRGMIYGTVMSSFAIEQFSFDRLKSLDLKDILKREEELIKMMA